MSGSRHAVEWQANMEIEAIISTDFGLESISLQWSNLNMWLKNKQPLREQLIYNPSMYRMNPVLGYSRLKLAEATVLPNIQYRFYEVEPFRVSINERFECYRAANGIEVFVDNGPILAVLLTSMVKYPKIKIDFAINHYILGHMINIQQLKDTSWIDTFMQEELETPTPALPVPPYMQ